MSIYPPVRDNLIRLLSTPRLSTYSNACGGNVASGLELYRWNLDVSMAFFESIHYFEVALRNSIDSAMTKWFESAYPAPMGEGVLHWFEPDKTYSGLPTPADLSGLEVVSQKKVRAARHNAGKRNSPVLPGHVVAELTMGFWQYLIRQTGTNQIWRNALKNAFVPTTKQKRLESTVQQLVDLRNRIAHHEPIFLLDLSAEYTNLIHTAEAVSSGLGWWIDSTSRVETVLRRRPSV